jgi:hypothetical protein
MDQLRLQEKDAERRYVFKDVLPTSKTLMGDIPRTSHIFDGKTITKETAAFQLCDITDPMLKSMIEDPEALRETCNERDGWYTTHAFEQIKTVLRHKFFSVLEGHIVTDEECRILLETTEGSVKASLAQRSSKLRAGRHNMAKGALRPEDAAVRLALMASSNSLTYLPGDASQGDTRSQYEVLPKSTIIEALSRTFRFPVHHKLFMFPFHSSNAGFRDSSGW